MSRAGVSARTTSASNTTRTTFQRAVEAFVQTKTDLEQTHSRQHEVPLVEVTADRTHSADQTDIQQVVCTVQVVVKNANKSVNAYQVFADFRCDKETQVIEHHYLLHEEYNKIEQDGKEGGWLRGHPMHLQINNRILEAIDSRMCIERYAKSGAQGANIIVERYTRKFTEQNYYLKKTKT